MDWNATSFIAQSKKDPGEWVLVWARSKKAATAWIDREYDLTTIYELKGRVLVNFTAIDEGGVEEIVEEIPSTRSPRTIHFEHAEDRSWIRERAATLSGRREAAVTTQQPPAPKNVSARGNRDPPVAKLLADGRGLLKRIRSAQGYERQELVYQAWFHIDYARNLDAANKAVDKLHDDLNAEILSIKSDGRPPPNPQRLADRGLALLQTYDGSAAEIDARRSLAASYLRDAVRGNAKVKGAHRELGRLALARALEYKTPKSVIKRLEDAMSQYLKPAVIVDRQDAESKDLYAQALREHAIRSLKDDPVRAGKGLAQAVGLFDDAAKLDPTNKRLQERSEQARRELEEWRRRSPTSRSSG